MESCARVDEVARTGDVSIIPKWLTFEKINRASNPFVYGHYRAGDEPPPQVKADDASSDPQRISSRQTPAIESAAHKSNNLAPDLRAGKS